MVFLQVSFTLSASHHLPVMPMSPLLLDVRVAKSPEVLGQQAAEATRLLRRGDRAGALEIYQQVLAAKPRHPSTWSNLAALAVGLGEAGAARSHALRAFSMDPHHVDAGVNYGVASWHANQRRDAERAFRHALVLSPGLEAAALNLSLMLRLLPDNTRAAEVLATALQQNPGSVRMQQAMAGVCRLLGDTEATRVHAVAALSALLPTLTPAPGPDDGPEPENDESQRKLLSVMTETCDRLEAGGIAYNLIGGVVLGIVRQGRPFAGDKDLDLGLPFDVDRERVASLFTTGYTLIQVPNPEAARRWCLGFTHEATGVGVDLFFTEPVDGNLRICAGWPDDLLFDEPEYVIGKFHWQGRDWPVPAPVEDYLAFLYGVDWRSSTREFEGHTYDKRWFDTQVSSPSLTIGSTPRALNLGLLRMLGALGEQRWPKALALCDQLLARQRIIEVEHVRNRLLKAGIG